MNVLIHGGAGALGQAAISIALAHGCKIFITVSDNSKKRFLTKVFPDLPGKQFFNWFKAMFHNNYHVSYYVKLGSRSIPMCPNPQKSQILCQNLGFLGYPF